MGDHPPVRTRHRLYSLTLFMYISDLYIVPSILIKTVYKTS